MFRNYLKIAFKNLIRLPNKEWATFSNTFLYWQYSLHAWSFWFNSFYGRRRIKEIGIRKVLGASISTIVYLISKEFTKWVLIANIIAWPLAYYLMNNWLNNFAYRTEMGKLVGVCFIRRNCFNNCIGNSKFPSNQSSNSKPG